VAYLRNYNLLGLAVLWLRLFHYLGIPYRHCCCIKDVNMLEEPQCTMLLNSDSLSYTIFGLMSPVSMCYIIFFLV